MKTYKEFKSELILDIKHDEEYQLDEATHIVHTIKLGKEDKAGEPIKISATNNKDAWDKAQKAVDKLGGHYIDKVVSIKEEVELDEGFMDNVVKPLAITAAIAGATGVGSHFDKTHPSQFTADNTRYTIAHNPQDAQGRDAQKKTLNGKPHLVWQHKGQTFALPVNEETEIDEGASSILRAKHYLRVAEPRAKSDAIIAQAKGDKEAEAKANKRLSFTQHVRNKMDFPKLAVESSNPETYAQHLDHHVTTTEPTTANIIKMHDIINSAVKAGGSADHLYNQVAGNQFAHQKYRTAAS